MDGAGGALLHALGGLGADARCEHVAAGGRELGEECFDLFWGLALAEDDLREAAAQRPMVVQAGEIELLERQRFEPAHDRVDGHLAGGELGEQFTQGLRIHVRHSGGAARAFEAAIPTA